MPRFQLPRREMLRLGLAGLAGLTLPELLRRRSMAGGAEKAEPTALIVVWLHGGASHLETYDPKPLASSEFRGPFNPIDTAVSGLRICELLPRHARVADRFTILRSMVHTGFCHQQGAQQMLTGHPVRELKQKPDHPDLMSIASFVRRDPARSIPGYVGVNPIPYLGSAYLGPAFEPFGVGGDPNSPDFKVPNVGLQVPDQVARLGERISLRKKIDRFPLAADQTGNMRAFDDFEGQAWNLLTGTAATSAFDLSQVDAGTRDRYGRNAWGQQCLLARRLVEAGVDIVTTTFNGSLCGRVGNWDDHAVNHHVFNAMQSRAPYFDQAVSALVEDLYDRGLDRRVMLLVTGEFGRTPRISYSPDSGSGAVQPGRDHWPSVTSLLVSGGGIATGQVIGATDSRGEQVTERRVGVGDLLATLYRHLGIDVERVAPRDLSGRPIPLLVQGGQPIPELCAAKGRA